jgi:hypothetical protein
MALDQSSVYQLLIRCGWKGKIKSVSQPDEASCLFYRDEHEDYLELSKMNWSEIRSIYPDQWLVVEALEAHTTPDNRRQIERLAVVEACTDGSGAMKTYRRLHQQYPAREFYFVHTSREELDIRERQWLGIRRGYAATTG